MVLLLLPPNFSLKVKLTRSLGSCGWLTFLFAVYTDNIDAVLSVGQQV